MEVMTGILLSLIAGLSTTIGSLVIFLVRDIKKSFLAFSLAFSTGVMITISFIELLPKGIELLGQEGALLAFFCRGNIHICHRLFYAPQLHNGKIF